MLTIILTNKSLQLLDKCYLYWINFIGLSGLYAAAIRGRL